MKHFILIRLLPAGFACVGIAILIWTGSVYSQGQESEDWPSVDGHVIAASVEHRSQSGSTRTRTTYSASVTYDYAVDGVAYTGDRMAFGAGHGSGDRAKAQRVVDRYAVGSAVTVHYRPANPSDSVLEPGSPRSLLGLLAIGAVFLCVGLAGLILMPWASRRGMIHFR